jgi:glycosyltransferase 2 family protein
MRRWLILAASILVSAIFLWLALRGVPLTEVLDGIRQANFGWVLVSLLGVVGAQMTRAVRWRGLLNNHVPLIPAIHILNVTMLVNQLPLRAGEVARSLLATRYGVPFVTAATSIVIERLIDVVTVVLMLAYVLNRLPNAPEVSKQAALLLGAAAVIGFAVLMIFARYPQVAHRLLGWFESRLPLIQRLHLRQRLDEVLDGLLPLTNLRSGAHVLIWTVLGWFFSLATFYALERALYIENVDLVLGSVLGVSLAAFSIAIPVSVAAIGPFESAVRAAGDAVGMSPVTSTTLGFLFHGVTVIGYAVSGTIGLIALGVSLSEMLAQPTTTSASD